MLQNYFLNKTPYGPVSDIVASVGGDLNLLRPFMDDKGIPSVMVNTGRKIKNNKGHRVPELKKVAIEDIKSYGAKNQVLNAATLPRDAWIRMDDRVVRQRRSRLRLADDMASVDTVSGFDAFGFSTWEYQSTDDPGEAHVGMEPRVQPFGDTVQYLTMSVPLAITYAGFNYGAREIAISANRGRGESLPTRGLDWAARRVFESIENQAVGTVTGLQYGTNSNVHQGNSQIVGATNASYRITKTDLTTPTGANPDKILEDILESIDLLRDSNFNGPYMVYHSTAYSRFLDEDYFRSGSTSVVRSVRQRLMELSDVMDIRRLDTLTDGFQLLVIEMTPEVLAWINGVPVRVVQWDRQGGLDSNYLVMGIQVPVFYRPFDGIAGWVHATTA